MALSYRGAARVAGLFAASLMTLAAAPAVAASSATLAFLANVVPNVDFLDRSSRFALKNSKNPRVRDFAFAMACEQTRAADALYDWTLADAGRDAKPSIAPTAAGALDKTPTGSAAPSANAPPSPIGWQVPQPPAKLADERLPRGQEDLDSLEGLDGKAFDAEFKEKQTDALTQVAADYRGYAAKGDDPALKALAVRQLPKVTRRLTQIGKL